MYGRALNNLANLLQKTNRLQEAEGLFRASLEIDIAHYGPEHPHLAGKLGNLGLLLSNIGNVREAEPMLRRALTFNEQSLDENHPDIARNLNNLATLLVETGRATEAEPMFRRQMQILMKFTADNKSEHKNLIPACENYLAVLIELGRTKAVALANIAEMAERYDLPL
jgi:tetratricopeptide (TPR) repeat protein